jgi:hypothetical protein
LQKIYYWNNIIQGETQWTNASFVILHRTDLARKAPTASMNIRGTKGTVFFAVQVHTAPAHIARTKSTSMEMAVRSAYSAVLLHWVLAAPARTESTKDNSVQSNIKKQSTWGDKMLNPNLINTLNQYFETHKLHDFVVNPSIPILYFGDEIAYRKSECKVITVGKNPSLNEFCKNNKKQGARQFDIKHKFPNWNGTNLTQVLNEYFKQDPLKQWFSSFEPILRGLKCSYYQNTQFQNIALHTDICSPIATEPTWSKLKPNQQQYLNRACRFGGIW